jgi:hypothetical protein
MNVSASMAMIRDEHGRSALMTAVASGQVGAMRVVLMHAADPAAMLMLSDNEGETALSLAAWRGNVEAMRVLLDHPSADAAAMVMITCVRDWTALMSAAHNGHVDAMRVLLDHPSANAAEMMMHASGIGTTALMLASRDGVWMRCACCSTTRLPTQKCWRSAPLEAPLCSRPLPSLLLTHIARLIARPCCSCCAASLWSRSHATMPSRRT